MNFSELDLLRPQIYNYLGFKGAKPSPEIDDLIGSCMADLEKAAQFNYLYKIFETPPEFLNKPPYLDFLKDSRGVIISVMTLGIGVDRLVSRLSYTDMTRSAVTDCCASAYLEYLSDGFEKGIGENLSYRFCPGYGGSSVNDLKYIFDILRPEKIGVTLSSSFFMLPSKSMAGVIAIGGHAKKSCKDCFMAKSCNYLKEGHKCYDPGRR